MIADITDTDTDAGIVLESLDGLALGPRRALGVCQSDIQLGMENVQQDRWLPVGLLRLQVSHQVVEGLVGQAHDILRGQEVVHGLVLLRLLQRGNGGKDFEKTG